VNGNGRREFGAQDRPSPPFCGAAVAAFPVLGLGSKLRRLHLTKLFRQLAMGEKTFQCEIPWW